MILDDLKKLIRSTQWFVNLGSAAATQGIIPMDLARWRQFCIARTKAEFGLPQDTAMTEEFSFANMVWFPTANEDPDPIHGQSLVNAAHELKREAEFKAARFEVFRLVLASQRGFSDQQVLKVGPTDFNEAARMAGRYAYRMAASEIVVSRIGFWCDMVRLYHDGHWPFGYLPSSEVVVL